jgi:hypothetical protein
MTAYQYAPLQGRNVIRLLQLEPNPDESAPIYGTFQSISLDADPPDFEALSYVWGDPTFTDTIKIGTDDLPIPTANLGAALRRFRRADKPRLIWADAICINQNDLAERNRQVLMMARVYQQAKMTICWLGQGDVGAEEALRALVQVADLAPRFGQPSREIPAFKSQTPIGSADDMADMEGDPSEAIAAAIELRSELVFTNPWFTRLWIVQEAMLASSLTLYLGDAETDWAILEAAATLLYRAFRRTGRRFPGVEAVDDVVGLIMERSRQRMFRPPAGLDATSSSQIAARLVLRGTGTTSRTHTQVIRQLRRFRDQGQQIILASGRSQDFLETIWGFRYRKCGDDRDRIYAMRSFVPWDMPVHVHVNYSRTVVAVYTAFARELLNAGIMDVLLLAGLWDRRKIPGDGEADEDKDEAPSWVYDFRLSKLRRGTGEPWSHLLHGYDETISDFEPPASDGPTYRLLLAGHS